MNISDRVPSGLPWTPKNTIPIEPSDALCAFLNLRLLTITIVVGGTLAAWMPTVESMEKY